MKDARRGVMETEVQAVLDALADLREKANVNFVFGEPVTAGGRTVIPVARVAYGFRMGVRYETGAGEGTAGEKNAEEISGAGRGSGGGVMARPLAVVEVTPDATRVKPIVDGQRVALAVVLLAGWVVFWLARALIKIFGRQG
jgi:uncharacterized spore protein YtfJ